MIENEQEVIDYLKKEENEIRRNRKYTLAGLLLFTRFLIFDNPLLPNLKESYSDWNIYSKFYNYFICFSSLKVYYPSYY